jgi:hypothetical protein
VLYIEHRVNLLTLVESTIVNGTPDASIKGAASG